MYVVVSFVEDQLPIGLQVYFCALHSVPLICMSVFVPVPCHFYQCSFVVMSSLGGLCLLLCSFSLGSLALFFFLRITLVILSLLWFHINLTIIWEFLGSPVVRTWCFHCQVLGLIPSWETKILKVAWHGPKNQDDSFLVCEKCLG